MPMMQSFIKAGDFTVKGKLKSAVIDNAIYYGSYLFICGVLLIYLALKPGIDLNWWVHSLFLRIFSRIHGSIILLTHFYIIYKQLYQNFYQLSIYDLNVTFVNVINTNNIFFKLKFVCYILHFLYYIYVHYIVTAFCYLKHKYASSYFYWYK